MSKLRNSIIYQCLNQGAGPHLARGRGGHLGRAGPELGTRHQPGPGHWRLAGHVPPLHVSPRVLAPSTDTDNVSAAGGTVNKWAECGHHFSENTKNLIPAAVLLVRKHGGRAAWLPGQSEIPAAGSTLAGLTCLAPAMWPAVTSSCLLMNTILIFTMTRLGGSLT